MKDREREATSDFPYRFDFSKAERFFKFAKLLRHYKGEWAGKVIELQPYQQFRLGSLFGWVHVETGRRRFRTAYNEIPRKNGKSLEAAIVALYGTFYDGEPGAEGYTIATKRYQAKIVFNDARKLVLSSGLKDRIKAQVANLHRDATESKLEPLGADHDSTDGLNPHVVIVDEFHAHKDRGLIDVMETATGARRQPILFQITTAGEDALSPCGDQHDYACKILDGVIHDETFFCFIAHCDQDDDWTTDAAARKANPNYGVSVNPEDLRGKVLKAKTIPAASAAYKQKHLNIWVESTTPWLSLEQWRAGQSTWTPDRVAGRRCYVGVDLSSKTDLAAVVFVFPPLPTDPKWRLLCKFYTPQEGLIEREQQARAPYRQWIEQGHLKAIPGNRIDHAVIRDDILAGHKVHPIRRLGFDPWNIGNLDNDLLPHFDEDGIVEIPQTIAHFSEPCKEFEAEVGAAHVDAAGHPVMTWMVSNAVVIRDSKDNIFPTKNPKKMRGRVDGVFGAVMGMKLALPFVNERPKPKRQGARIWTPDGFKPVLDATTQPAHA